MTKGEIELASSLQCSTLPVAMPQLPGYDSHGRFLPPELTGGDTFDLAVIPQGLWVVLADATGHGIAPALSVTRMHAMLRMAPVHAFQHQAVKVTVAIGRPAQSLDQRDRAAVGSVSLQIRLPKQAVRDDAVHHL